VSAEISGGSVIDLVLMLLAERLRSWRSIYGELSLGTDRRDLQHEARKKAADLAM
jgi:hypothetical protein